MFINGISNGKSKKTAKKGCFEQKHRWSQL